jgi:DUF1365 family protein
MASHPLSLIVRGRVMHRRHEPVAHRFVYPVFFLLLNCDELEILDSWLFGINRRRPLAFHFTDHGDGRDPRIWVREQLQQAGIDDCHGPIWVQTFPRLFGYVFNPVSFWYCQRADGSVGAIIAEVNNTFGERHCYLLTPDPKTGRYTDVFADKRMYVSPFFPVEGGYRFHFNTDFTAPRVSIDYFRDDRLQLNTAIWGRAKFLSNRTLLSALLRQPLLTLGVILRIHWQAFHLWRKGVSIYHRTKLSAEEISR